MAHCISRTSLDETAASASNNETHALTKNTGGRHLKPFHTKSIPLPHSNCMLLKLIYGPTQQAVPTNHGSEECHAGCKRPTGTYHHTAINPDNCYVISVRK
jgi:hypothetical protein